MLEERIENEQIFWDHCKHLSEYFKPQLVLIKDLFIHDLVVKFLDEKVDPAVFEKPTSSTGKYHPSYQNVRCGNGIHTKNVVKILRVFERAHPNLNWDVLYASAILHDCTKYENKDSQFTDVNHASTASKKFEEFGKEYIKSFKKKWKFKKLIKAICYNIKWHEGRFCSLNATKTQIKENYTKKFYRNVKTKEAHLLHLADMLSASKSLQEEVF